MTRSGVVLAEFGSLSEFRGQLVGKLLQEVGHFANVLHCNWRPVVFAKNMQERISSSFEFAAGGTKEVAEVGLFFERGQARVDVGHVAILAQVRPIPKKLAAA